MVTSWMARKAGELSNLKRMQHGPRRSLGTKSTLQQRVRDDCITNYTVYN